MIEVKSITGLTMIQGFFASATAMLFYNEQKRVNKPLVFSLGFSLFLSSLSGALISKVVSDRLLLLIFGVLSLVAAVAMFVPRSYSEDDLTEDKINFDKSTAIIIGIFVGFLLGLVGQGGAFILVPILLYLLRIPLRVALGSTLAIGLFSSSAGLLGKVVTGQVPFLMTIALLLGVVPAARLGSYIGNKTDIRILRWLLALLIAASAVRIWMSIL
jgi:uncharacterized membrane protein YfcA